MDKFLELEHKLNNIKKVNAEQLQTIARLEQELFNLRTCNNVSPTIRNNDTLNKNAKHNIKLIREDILDLFTTSKYIKGTHLKEMNISDLHDQFVKHKLAMKNGCYNLRSLWYQCDKQILELYGFYNNIKYLADISNKERFKELILLSKSSLFELLIDKSHIKDQYLQYVTGSFNNKYILNLLAKHRLIKKYQGVKHLISIYHMNRSGLVTKLNDTCRFDNNILLKDLFAWEIKEYREENQQKQQDKKLISYNQSTQDYIKDIINEDDENDIKEKKE